MESVNSSPSSSSNSVEAEEAIAEKSPEQWFNEQAAERFNLWHESEMTDYIHTVLQSDLLHD